MMADTQMPSAVARLAISAAQFASAAERLLLIMRRLDVVGLDAFEFQRFHRAGLALSFFNRSRSADCPNPQPVARHSSVEIIPAVSRHPTRCELGQLALRNPNGIESFSPRLRGRATLGLRPIIFSTRNGLHHRPPKRMKPRWGKNYFTITTRRSRSRLRLTSARQVASTPG
jgi:hypothetical protein